MSKKLIGIVGWSTGENSFGVTKPYMNFFSTYGKVVVLGPTDDIVENLDLLVLPGGADISSHFYNQIPFMWNTNPDLFKEYFFVNNLPKYIENNIPIFGICLGMQQICVHFKANMIQNIGNHSTSLESRSDLVHELCIMQNYVNMFPYKKSGYKVNSLHHQAVNFNKFPTCLDIVAISKKDNFLEIIKHKTKNIWGVQYHPEEIYDDISDFIVKMLLNNN